MDTRRTFLTLAAIPLLLVPMGCAGQADDSATPTVETRDGDMALAGVRVELTVPADHANSTEMGNLVQHLEGQGEVAQAKAAVQKSSEDSNATVTVDLWGADLPTEEEIVDELQAEYPYLAGTQIHVTSLDPATEPLPQEEHDDKDPEVLRQEIIDDLRAKGVEGEIEVVITELPEGGREVEVQVHDDQPPPA
ncbi:MAG: hypothetical protein K0V04_13180 [Deltaproteobacteria bacterium]|nr:hypothetical protein [Deltaproteobacteria bacterium]